MPARRILVIEDDDAIREGIVDALGMEGFLTEEASAGKQALALALSCECDLVLLDLILPELDGLEILREIRVSRPTLPVIILTARSEEKDRVAGLKLGADDYVVKPFSLVELLARIEAVIRRSPERPTDISTIDIPGGIVDFTRGEIRFDKSPPVTLSQRETELLRYLVINAGRTISRDEILTRIWRISPSGIDTRTIDMHIARLREKLRDDITGDGQHILLTVRGKGYMFAKRESQL